MPLAQSNPQITLTSTVMLAKARALQGHEIRVSGLRQLRNRNCSFWPSPFTSLVHPKAEKGAKTEPAEGKPFPSWNGGFLLNLLSLLVSYCVFVLYRSPEATLWCRCLECSKMQGDLLSSFFLVLIFFLSGNVLIIIFKRCERSTWGLRGYLDGEVCFGVVFCQALNQGDVTKPTKPI